MTVILHTFRHQYYQKRGERGGRREGGEEGRGGRGGEKGEREEGRVGWRDTGREVKAPVLLGCGHHCKFTGKARCYYREEQRLSRMWRNVKSYKMVQL